MALTTSLILVLAALVAAVSVSVYRRAARRKAVAQAAAAIKAMNIRLAEQKAERVAEAKRLAAEARRVEDWFMAANPVGGSQKYRDWLVEIDCAWEKAHDAARAAGVGSAYELR